MKYKGKTIHPYESFYWNTTYSFNRGELGGGISRTVKCDDSLATLVMEQTEDITVQQVGNIVENKENGFKNPQRGRVYSPNGLAPCLNTVTGGGLEPKVIVEGYYAPSKHNASRILNPSGISPTVMENHGTVNAIVEPIIFDDYNQRIPKDQSVIGTITTNIGASAPRNGIKIIEPTIMAMRGRNPDNPSERGKSNGKYKQRLEMNNNGTSNTITSVQKDNLVVEPKIINAGYVNDGKHQQDFVQHEDGICRTICTGTHASTTHLLKTMVSEPIEPTFRIRKLTPREAFRLMGVDDKDIDTIQSAKISNSAQYKLAGNSIVVDVLYHIFRKAFVETNNEQQQLTLF